MLSDIESQALNPFEEKENVDARFVEESALMQTLIQLEKKWSWWKGNEGREAGGEWKIDEEENQFTEE